MRKSLTPLPMRWDWVGMTPSRAEAVALHANLLVRERRDSWSRSFAAVGRRSDPRVADPLLVQRGVEAVGD